MKVWFEGTNDIQCNLQHVALSLEDLGEHYVGVVSLMPGLSSVELVEQGDGFVTIRTNEGLMKRTGITKQMESESIVIEFDEEYQAGSMVTTRTHYVDEFTVSDTGIRHQTILSGVEAPGILGFFYRNFGKSSTGKAILNSYKSYLEQQET